MGNWRHRPPRRQYHHKNPQYDYELPSDYLQDNVPPWEKKFCYVVGSVPWGKVVSTNCFMSCHSNVLNWDDSAVEETFQNAKKRFWAQMNGFRCDTSLPDPDIYIDEIDWNMDVDLDLMKEVEQEFFAAADEEGEVNKKLLRKFKKIRNSVWGPSNSAGTNPVADMNPWQVNGVSESTERNSHAKASKNVDNNRGSWEVEAAPANVVVENDAHGHDGNNSSGCERTNRDSNENPWERGNQGSVLRKDNGWGGACNKDWGRNRGGWCNPMNLDNSWGQGSHQPDNQGWNNREWSDYGNKARHCSKQNRDFEFRRSSNRGEAWHGNNSFKRREGYHQNEFAYKNSRFRADENPTSNCWNTKTNKKRRVY